MKKRVLAITLLVVMILTMSVQAISPRLTTIKPVLSFSGRTAECAVDIWADHTTDEISVTMKLWRGASCLETWTESGEGHVYLYGEHTVPMRGWSYKLTAEVTLNGEYLGETYDEATCP